MISVSRATKADHSTFQPSGFYIKDCFECQGVDIPKIISSFNTCPYYNIRQLIVSFISNFPPNQDIPDAKSLLALKYQAYPQSRQIDSVLMLNIHFYRQQKRKHQHLINCLQVLITDCAQIKQLQQQCQRQQQQTNRLNHNELLSNLQQQFTKLKALDIKYKDTMNMISSFNYYAEYLISAILQIIKHLNIINNYPVKNLQQYVQDLRVSLENILEFIQFNQQEKIRFRHKVKFQGPLKHADKINIRKNQIEQIKKIYNLLYKLEPEIKKYITQIKLVSVKVREEYVRFLVVFEKCEDIQKAKQNRDRHISLIQQQKQKLTNHLRKNLELMIKYQRSVNYANLLQYMKPRAHVMNMFSQNMQQLEHAIKFINEDYDVLYQQICEKRNNYARNQLERQIEYFKAAKQDGYNTIILNFLSRLLKL